MQHLLVLEAIGHHLYAMTKERRLTSYVNEITGMNSLIGLVRKPVRPEVDYSQANSVGSRGVRFCYRLKESTVYEVSSRISWGKTDNYFALHDGAEWKQLNGEEVLDCLLGKSL